MTATVRHRGLRSQLVLWTVGLVAVQGLAAWLVLGSMVRDLIDEDLHKLGRNFAEHLAEIAVDEVLTERTIPLQLLVNDYAHDHDEIEYAFVLDAQGRVLAHTFPGGFPTGLRDADPLQPGGLENSRLLSVDGRRVYDVAVPLVRGAAGVVRVGISADEGRSALRRIVAWHLAILGLVFLAGLVAAVSYGMVLARPIRVLSEAAKALGRGDPHAKVDLRASREIEQLGEVFNAMAEELHRSRAALLEDKEFRDNVLRSIHDALFVLSPGGRIISVNPAAAGLLGFHEDELVDELFAEICDDASRATCVGADGAPNTLRNVECRLRAKDGRLVPVVLSSSPVRDDTGRVQGIVCAARAAGPA